jgi:hypothetical protein
MKELFCKFFALLFMCGAIATIICTILVLATNIAAIAYGIIAASISTAVGVFGFQLTNN